MQKVDPEHEAEGVEDARFASPTAKTSAPVVTLAGIAEKQKGTYKIIM